MNDDDATAQPNTSGLVISGDALALMEKADAAIDDAPVIQPEEDDYSVGEVSPEGEIRTVRIYGKDVPVGLLTEMADPKCPNCWSSYDTPLQGSYVATRIEKGKAVRQRQLCECTIRRYVKRNPKEAPAERDIKVALGDGRIWAEQAVRLKRRIDLLGAHPQSEARDADLVKLRRRYDRALERAKAAGG